MAKFWLATFGKKPAAALNMSAIEPEVSMADPLVEANDPPHAIEIIENNGEHAVLFSIINDPDDPKTFLCRIGFGNGPKSCVVWGGRGFPLIDAIIAPTKNGGLTVSSQSFVSKDDPVPQYDRELVSITKLPTGLGARASKQLANTQYNQALLTPDVVSPGTQVGAKALTWFPISRTNVKEWTSYELTFHVNTSRYPGLKPFSDAPQPPTKIWSGDIALPLDWDHHVNPKFPDKKVETVSRADIFGAAAFQFEDVEVLGFRIDPRELGFGDKQGLDRLAGLMAQLVEPLNFHLHLSDEFPAVTRSAVSDFQFRPATYTIMVELLRYGKMKLKKTTEPFTTADFQSQHELLARILVGRVDDDTAQARDPATFVPAIFVDNSWSKILGRNQGLDKRMANFYARDKGENGRKTPLRLPPDDPNELGSISEIALTTRSGDIGSQSSDEKPHTLLKLDCPYEEISDWDDFVRVDPQLVLRPVSIAPMSWLQTDFDQAEYRRSFARSVIRNRYREFSSIQASPVGEKNLRSALQKQTTWITGTTKLGNNLRLAQPTGTIGLKFYADPSAPLAWKILCKLFGASGPEEGRVVMPPGSWYRMQCSMDLTVENSLD